MVHELICGQRNHPSVHTCGEGGWDGANGNPAGALGHTEAGSYRASSPMAPAQVGAGLTGWLCSRPLRWLLQVVATSKGPHLKQGLASSFLRALSGLMRSLRGSLLNGFK